MKNYYVTIRLFEVPARSEADAVALTKEYIKSGILPGGVPEFDVEEQWT